MIVVMPVLRLQVRLPYYTNIPEDVLTNTWHFFSDGVTPTNDAITYCAGRLLDVYELAYGGTVGAPWVMWDQVTVHGYNLADAPPRVPFIVPMPITGVTSTSTETSPETAICLSFQGVLLPGTPQARRRGRIYFGALTDAVIDPGTDDSFPIPNVAWINALVAEVEAKLLDTEDAGIQWVIWSPTSSASVPVNNGWVDNALDTQRRRGFAPTSRIVFP